MSKTADEAWEDADKKYSPWLLRTLLRKAVEATAREVAREEVEQLRQTVSMIGTDVRELDERTQQTEARVQHLYDVRDEDLQAEQELEGDSPGIVRRGDSWFAQPGGPGTDVGPYSTPKEAWDFLVNVREIGQDAPAPRVTSNCEHCKCEAGYDFESRCDVCRKHRRPHHMNKEIDPDPPAPSEGEEGEVEPDLPNVVVAAIARLRHTGYHSAADRLSECVASLQRERDEARERATWSHAKFLRKRIQELVVFADERLDCMTRQEKRILDLEAEIARLRDRGNWEVVGHPKHAPPVAMDHTLGVPLSCRYVGPDPDNHDIPPESEGESDGEA